MKKVTIYYFSGTGNTQWIAYRLKEFLEKSGATVSLMSIESLSEEALARELPEADHLVIGFPVYGSVPPRLMQHFLEKLPTLEQPLPLTMFATHALASGDSAYYAGKPLEKKGYSLFRTRHFKMMNNFHLPNFRFYKPDNGEKLDKILEKALPSVETLSREILSEERHIIGNNLLGHFLGNIQRKHVESLIDKLAVMISVKKTRCIRCSLCVNICPVTNIAYDADGNISFGNSCIACMRCYSQCPKNAILFGDASASSDKYPRFKGPKGVHFEKRTKG